jgi:hypothetical protein
MQIPPSLRYHCALCLLLIHYGTVFLLSAGIGRLVSLFVDLGENAESILVMVVGENLRGTNSWSLNREYSSSPTLTGEPPYCQPSATSSPHLIYPIYSPPIQPSHLRLHISLLFTKPILPHQTRNRTPNSPEESKPYLQPQPNN